MIGEIHRRGAGRQLDHTRLRRHHVDAFVALGRFGGGLARLARAARRRPGRFQRGRNHRGLIAGLDLAVPGQQLAHPRQLPVVLAGRGDLPALGAGFLVAPVRGHAVLGELVHLARADLHLERPAVVVSHHRVQRAVAVGLGPRNIVVEFLGDGRPHLVHHAQRRIAVAHVVDDDAQRAQVVHLGEVQTLDAHLVPDAVDMLGPAADLGVHAAGGQRRLQALDRAGDEGLALDPLFFQQARDLLVAVGLQETERKVFHFPLDLPDAEPVGQRRVQVQGLARELDGTGRLALGVPAQRAQPRGQPHQHDAQVGCHGQQHLALHFLLRTAFGGDVAGVPGHHAQTQQRPRALHQPRHFLAERGGDRIVAQRRRGRGRVGGQSGQQGRGAGSRVGMHAGQDANHARAVRGQRLPVGACWPSKRGSAQATAWSISARPSASRPSPASCRQEASKGVGASGTGEADMTGKLGGLQGNDQNISTLYTSVCPH